MIQYGKVSHAGINFGVLTAGSGFPLICLHGGASPAHHFTELMTILAKDFYVIAYDQRGFAGTLLSSSDAMKTSNNMTIDHPSWARDVVGIMDALGLERAAILGWSMGASIAINAAAWFAERIEALVLLGAPDPTKKVDVRRLQEVYDEIGSLSNNQKRSRYRSEFSRFVSSHRATDNTLLNRLVSDRMVNNPQYADQIVAAIKTRPDLSKTAPLIKCPVHLIVGDQDKICPPESARKLASYVTNATIDFIENCGHYYALEQPEEIARLVKSRLAKVCENKEPS